MLFSLLKYALVFCIVATGLYAGLLLALTTPFCQSHVVYLHAFQQTGGKDLAVPEMFGFLRGQVTPFRLPSGDGTPLFSWHILPVGLYLKHEEKLASAPAGITDDITSTLGFQLLRDDPEARLVVHFHGAGGNVGSGYRVPNYKALSAAQPDKVHVLTFDYRGFGRTPGVPSEEGIIEDALAVMDWAIEVAGIPPSRILIFSQSLGTAVNTAVAERLASRSKPITLAGHILVAPFVDVATLVTTYSIAGTVPILAPVAKYATLFNWLRSYIRDGWTTSTRMENYVRLQEAAGNKYRITLIHAEDDYDIPWEHTPRLFSHAVNATEQDGVSEAQMKVFRAESTRHLGAAGSITKWQSQHGVITEHLLKYGLHDVIMGNPVITATAMDMLESSDDRR